MLLLVAEIVAQAARRHRCLRDRLRALGSGSAGSLKSNEGEFFKRT